VDSALDPWCWVSQLTDGRVSRDPDPDRAYRPFDRDACGYLPGEGGAFCVLEDAEAALAIRDGVIPATATTRAVPPDYDLDLVTGQSRPGPVTTALVLARGKWGFNSAVVLRAVRAESPAESTAP
jgi:3-oxoacyl-(acyl-carrier-protein) synthase